MIQNTNSPNFWIFTLGITLFDTTSSPSIEYFRGFAQTFIHRLLKIPELETLRENARVKLWQDLNQAFERNIKAFKGPVFEFFQTANPNI